MGVVMDVSMSLFLNCASTVIATTAEVVSLLYSQQKHESWASTWFLATAQTTKIIPG